MPPAPQTQTPRTTAAPADELLTFDAADDGAPTPSRAGVLGFAVLVLVLSATKLIAHIVDRSGASMPDWWLAFEELMGGGLSPLWAVLIVGGLTMGWSRLRRLLRASVRTRIDVRLYVVAVFAPATITAVAAALAAVATGAQPALATGTQPLPLESGLLSWLAPMLTLAPLFAVSENIGWRAWMQRGLQARLSPLTAGTVVGVVSGLWHWPLFEIEADPIYAQLPFDSFLLATVVRAVLLAALFNAASGSIIPVVVAHLSFNVAAQLSLPPDPGDAAPLYLALTFVSVAAAALVAWWSRSKAAAGAHAIL